MQVDIMYTNIKFTIKKKSTDIHKRNLISIHASKTKHELRQHFFLNM